MELYKHQLDFLKQNPNKSALVHSCGLGKTRTALEWLKLGPNKDNLVICPKALKVNWVRESNRWGAPIVVISKEEFKKHWDSLGKYNLVVDEVHNGFLTPHFKSQMSKALRDYIKKHDVERVLLLSATIYTSSPWNIYNLAHYLGHKIEWTKFHYMFFDDIWMGPRKVPVPKKGMEGKLAELTREIADVVNIYDVMDVPLQHHTEPEYFALNKEQQKAIEASYDPVPIVRYTKQHEIEQGVLIGNEFKEGEVFKCDKNERILSLVEENAKIAIVCRYNVQIDVLAKLLGAYKPLIIRGDVKNRDEICLQAESADKAVVLIQADCGLGFQLPSFPVCVFASMSYSYTSFEQMCGRFLRMDKPSRTTFIYLLTEGDSVDQGVFDAVSRKEDFKIELFRK